MFVDRKCTIGYYLQVKPTILALIGKPLSGKDTQADLLVAAHPEAVKISTGHILRAVREEGETHRFWPIVGPYIHMIDQGLKLPDGPIIDMLTRVAKEQIAEGKSLLVVAGSPRSFDQLDGFRAMAEETGSELHIIHVDTTNEETYRRSALRSEGRSDDTPSVHAVRLEEFRTHVQPVIESLRSEGHITEIDGMLPVEAVFKRIENVVRGYILDPEISLPMRTRR